MPGPFYGRWRIGLPVKKLQSWLEMDVLLSVGVAVRHEQCVLQEISGELVANRSYA